MDIETKFKSFLYGKKKVVLTTHLFPDADGIGSQISLAIALRKIGIDAICCNQEELLTRYQYLDQDNMVVSIENLPEKYKRPDGVIVVDTNTIYRAGNKLVNFVDADESSVLYIDHHPCSESTQKKHCIDVNAAATGQVVGELIITLGIEMTKQMALPLYTAILIDTSSFRYPTVSSSTHALVSKLMATGINPPLAYNGIYGTKKIQHLHALGSILSSADSTEDEKIAWISLKKDQLTKFNIDIEDTHGFINNLLILDNIKVACMFRDDQDSLKLSLRSTGDCDVGIIASALGGGGHSHSAATMLDIDEGSTKEEIIRRTIRQIEILLENQLRRR